MCGKSKYLVAIFFLFKCITIAFSGEQEICSLTDDECVYKAVRVAYPRMIAGIPGVEPSDPLHKEAISVNLPQFSYKLHNATLSGLKDVNLVNIKFYENGTITFRILLPVTTIKSDYEMHGEIGSMVLNGIGSCEIVYYDHYIDFIGKYFTNKDRIDKKLHNFIADFTFLSEVKGKRSYEYKQLTNDNKELTEDELQQLDDAVQSHVVTEFMHKHIEVANDFMRIVPSTEFLAKQN